MSDGIEVDAELVARRLAGLDLMPGRPKRQHLCFDDLDVVDSEVEVELLWPLAGRPRRRREIGSLLEGNAAALDHQRHPVLIVDGDLSAEQPAVELGERTWFGAIENNRAKASERGGHARSLAPPPSGTRCSGSAGTSGA